VAGITDGLAKAKTRLPEAELEAAFMAMQEKLTAAQAAVAEKNLAACNDYLAKNKAKPGVTVTASGLQYEVIKSGSGPKPKLTDTVKVHYHGTLIDGTVFDSSVERNEPVEFEVTGVIAGWTEALQLMSVGDKWKLTIPPAIGYGAQGKGRIPPNSVLIFEVELLAIK
jgi:FKBP-type peptidyl-prolyl cis-trans isomerase